jgi:outer membrane immunogenic protein
MDKMTFKATVIGAMASFLAFGAASAADLPSYKAPPPPPPPLWSWTGAHVGVSGGYGGGWAGYSSSYTSFAPVPVALYNVLTTRSTSGYLVGFQSGYSWQFANNIVAGYESEFNYADISTSNNLWTPGLRGRLNWFGAERLRFGYAFGRLLPYVTGGVSYGQVRTGGFDVFGGVPFLTPNRSIWQAGWTVGAGVEYAVLDNVSVKAEYLYSSLNGPNGVGLGFPGVYREFRGNGFDTHIARVGVNYQIQSFGALFGIPGLGL